MERYFKKAGDLPQNESNNVYNQSNNYFYPAGDLEESKEHNIHNFDGISTEKINNYLMTVVSGEEYPYECELGTICSSGTLMVNLNQLFEMVNDDSYNIVTAQCYNPEMISISFQKFDKKINKHY